MNSAPAQTRHSLLASATVAPRSAAASVGFRPAAPLIAAITQSAGRSAASISGGLAARRFDAGAGERVLQLAIGRRIGDGREARAELARELRERGGVAVRGHRLDAVAAVAALEQIDGARCRSSRSRRAA